MAFFGWREETSFSEGPISPDAAAEAEILSPLILPSRATSLGGPTDEEPDEKSVPQICREEIFRRRARKNALVTVGTGLCSSIIISAVLYGLTALLRVPLHIWMLCIQATENTLLVAVPCACLVWRFAIWTQGDDLIEIREREKSKDGKASFCLSLIEVGLGIYVFAEAHFRHRIGNRGMVNLMEFRTTMIIMAACALASALLFVLHGLCACVFSAQLNSGSLKRGAGCFFVAAFLNLVTAVEMFRRLAKWSTRAPRFQCDNFSVYVTIFAGSCLLVDGLFSLIAVAVRRSPESEMDK
ncbi:putative transmembrane protein [Toxoplasma gondii TgCatPRC2]|uniref:Transmembrane protein n=11 Tax=Toxoplasma gondii TaxID=5811 RepID=A0A125YZ47_TOXGM|nr:hypothetical protein TGME49_305250 [Toxoplasma gondii ME49]ESS29046.1 putative transmembrane protein [Toxoplasma gondii VEG]KFG28455.1 putative transmembrane protein [Toxoplasma gondii p89]KFG33278.1 putative transmembrane protein [Toxoplasma gondii GAB2-2007-GAL-DOM2]KFG45331.1 putative transmembrane protein [Toxoplasma gondii FOU]KFG59246.1 putative transmembrane protein [Toxoplasma gondii RUB]KFH02587.1 putative transmembrane protein [Toxoplasma gondii VAND]KYF44797.1 hypothetical prot|eukprot:XP_002370318.1 hypothetical protein TGME49_305250 [Toxoplasma gondii ME49]